MNQIENMFNFLNTVLTNIDETEYIKIINFTNKYINIHLPNYEEKNILNMILIIFLYYIKSKFFFGDEFYDQLMLNDNRNILAIINLILPYIDDKNNFKNQRQIKNKIYYK